MKQIISVARVGICMAIGFAALSSRVEAQEEPPPQQLIVGSAGGVVFVNKQAATPVTGLSGALEVSAGARPHPHSLIRARFLAFRADGNNYVVALSADLDLISDLIGVSATAGLSRGALTKGGNFAGLGVFGRLRLQDHVAIRLDASANTFARNDFSGVGNTVLLGLELAWNR